MNSWHVFTDAPLDVIEGVLDVVDPTIRDRSAFAEEDPAAPFGTAIDFAGWNGEENSQKTADALAAKKYRVRRLHELDLHLLDEPNAAATA